MDRYHSIIGPMVSSHWKPLKNHCVQWLPDYKTIEKPLVPMIFGPKTIEKNHWYQWFLDQKPLKRPLVPLVFGPKTIKNPLVTMVFETKDHRKTIDINSGFPTIHGEYENL